MLLCKYGIMEKFTGKVLFLLAACGGEQKKKKRFFGDTPLPVPQTGSPGKGRLPFAIPLKIELMLFVIIRCCMGGVNEMAGRGQRPSTPYGS